MMVHADILIVENETRVYEMLKGHLERLGCSVTRSTTSESAIKNLSSGDYEAVFAALCIKEKGARYIARWLKENKPHIQFFIVTGWKGELEPELLDNEGIHGVIHKPVIFEEIKNAFSNQCAEKIS